MIIAVRLVAKIEQRSNGGAPKISEAYDLMEKAAEDMGLKVGNIQHSLTEITLYGSYETIYST